MIFGKKQQPQEGEKKDPTDILGETLSGLTQTIQQMQQQMQQQASVLQQLQQHRAPEPPATPPKDPMEGIDFDELDNKSMLQLVGQMLDQKLSDLKGEVDGRVQEVNQKFSRKTLEDQIKETATSVGEEKFWLYRDDMRKLANQYPDLSPQDLYQLAVGKNPEPLQEYEQQKAEEEAAKNPQPSFGGLTPTSGRASMDSSQMDFRSAADKAWEDVMSTIPSNVIGGSNH